MNSENNNKVINVFAVDDHPLVLSGVTAALKKYSHNLHITGTALTAEDMFSQFEDLACGEKKGGLPDVILLDIILPKMSGTEAAKILKKTYPSSRILVFSAESSESAIYELLKIGIDGFVSKTSPGKEIAAAAECVGNGSQYFGMDTSRILENIRIAEGPNQKDTMFTQRELEVIELCCQGLLSKEIADRLCLSPRTIDNHKGIIFKKLGINNSVELVRYAVKNDIIKL